MPFFGDLGKLAESLLETGRDNDHFFDSTKVALKTKASNGASFEVNKEIPADKSAGDADGKVSYKHSSGINLKELKMDSKGVTSVKTEVAGVVDNTKFNMAVKTRPGGNSTKKPGKKAHKFNEETGSLGFKYDDKTVAADVSVDFLCGDAPMVKGNVVAAVPGVDGAHVGFDMSFRTSLDTWGDRAAGGGALKGAKGLQIDGANTMTDFPWKVAAQYALSDMQLAAVYSSTPLDGKKDLAVKYHQVLASDCNVGVQMNLDLAKKEGPAPTFFLGGSYNLDPDTTVFGKLSSAADSKFSLGVEQQLNSKVKLNMATAVSAADLSNHEFGFGIEFSN